MIEEYCCAICSMRHVVVRIMHHVVGRYFINSSQQNSYVGKFLNQNAACAIGRVSYRVAWLAREVAIYMTSFITPISPNGHAGASLMSK